MSINKAILIGRLGKDPELKHLPTGSAVCSFSVATSESWVDKAGQKQEKTEWHNIQAFGNLAEVCAKYLSKGKQVYLEGKIAYRSYENKEGATVYITEIKANKVEFLSPADSNQGAIDAGHNKLITTDEIPF